MQDGNAGVKDAIRIVENASYVDGGFIFTDGDLSGSNLTAQLSGSAELDGNAYAVSGGIGGTFKGENADSLDLHGSSSTTGVQMTLNGENMPSTVFNGDAVR